MLRSVVFVCGLCACDRAFGLEPTRGITLYFDAGIDAPYACPMMGPPKFGNQLLEELAQNCQSFTTSETGGVESAMARCGGNMPSYGTPPAQLQTIVLPFSGTEAFVDSRLAPEGDQAIVSYADPFAMPAQTAYSAVYARDGNGNWSRTHLISKAVATTIAFPYPLASTPTRRPGAHVVLLDNTHFNMPPQLIELADDGNPDPNQPWSTVMSQSLDLSVFAIPEGPLSLTPDGRRLVYYGTVGSSYGIYYTERAGLGVPFGTPVLLSALPDTANTDPFLTGDCSRLYVSGLGAVFYVQQ